MKAFTLLSIAPLALAQTLCEQYSHSTVDGYYANNNKWGAALGTGQQCTYVDEVSSSGIAWRADWTWSGNDDAVKSYPYAGRTLADKKLVNEIGSIPTQADWGYSGDSIRANVAYDMFTASDPAHETSGGDYEIMVWLANYGDLWPVGSSVGTVEVEGQTWTLWDGFNGAMHVYTFVSDAARHSVDLDAKGFFDYLRDNKGFPTESQHLTESSQALSSSRRDDATTAGGENERTPTRAPKLITPAHIQSPLKASGAPKEASNPRIFTFNAAPAKTNAEAPSLIFDMGKLNLGGEKKKPVAVKKEEEFAKHMRFLDAETENTTPSDVLTAPIFTQAVQRHVLAEHDRTGRSDKSKPFAQYGLLAGDASGEASDPRLFFNVAAPSSTFICGSQGSGKSHSLSCLLENCLLQNEVNMLPKPLTGIVFHYDTFVSDSGGSPCEAAFLSSNPGVDVRVLCAPTNVAHIKRIYAKLPNVTIEVLRINQEHLNTKRMLDLMAVSSVQGTLPLYLHVVIRILRDLRVAQQQKGSGFNYAKFKRDLDEQSLTDAQLAPLKQRLNTLESFMVSDQARAYEMALGRHVSRNRNNMVVDPQHGNSWSPKAGQLTIVDLSCPCVTAEMACSLFGICLSLFLEQDTQVGRVVALDEAHKYMTNSAECQALTENLLSTIRLQRHIATRVIISTQEPTISPRLLDLCSVTIVHRFTSPDWMRALQKHLAGASSWLDPNVNGDQEGMKKGSKTETGIRPLGLKKDDVAGDLFSRVVRLRTGEALLFAPSAVIDIQTAGDGTVAAHSGEDSTYDSGFNGKEGGGTSTTPVFAFGRSYGAPKGETPTEKRVLHLGNGVLKIRIRKRVTTDGGRSIMAG
ncbi:uncharacterized protein J7T54_004186 [Emericellopsis cladophorae]|uniref:Uncharacterized protein n=1 Tax=Emericellopsis cladophorae TaxID=2686198 RepID=A0A9Q0BBP7_9HYPO|nr:uncharacterized protein J7T54_004186 [Emericellopsis cladophorae]KAI6778279.1 hypothetical protein J7T54_004186 [Emericellopsis cladophorae]